MSTSSNTDHDSNKLISSDKEDSLLEIEGKFVCFVAVTLGALTSLGLIMWILAFLEHLAFDAMAISPIGLLFMIGHIVREQAYVDWQATKHKPLIVRLLRVYVIGFLWPVWLRLR